MFYSVLLCFISFAYFYLCYVEWSNCPFLLRNSSGQNKANFHFMHWLLWIVKFFCIYIVWKVSYSLRSNRVVCYSCCGPEFPSLTWGSPGEACICNCTLTNAFRGWEVCVCDCCYWWFVFVLLPRRIQHLNASVLLPVSMSAHAKAELVQSV